MPTPSVLVRTPVLPIEEILALNAFLHTQPEELESALRALFAANPLVEEAIFVASPALHAQLGKWQAGGLSHKPKETRRLLLTLYRYVVRMSTRCTPYGLFAATTTAEWGPATALRLGDQEQYHRHVRLDMNFLAGIADQLCRQEKIRQQLAFQPNTSLYRVGDSYKYVEYKLGANNHREYTIARVDYSPYLEAVLGAATRGRRLAELAPLLVGEDISLEEAVDFLRELVEAQVLVHELEPNVTGEEFFSLFVARIASLPNTTQETRILRQIQLLLAAPQASSTAYAQIQQLVQELLPGPPAKDYLQVDYFSALAQGTVQQDIGPYLAARLPQLQKLFSPQPCAALVDFKQQFALAYEGREMPLAYVLDPDCGIGYDVYKAGNVEHVPLLEGITPPAAPAPARLVGKHESKLLNLYIKALADQSPVVQLQQKEVTDLDDYAGTGFGSCSVLGTLLAAPEGSPADWKFLVRCVSVNSAAHLSVRFAHGQAAVHEHVRALSEQETPPEGVIYAEIAHLPQARVGNVLLRPHLRAYEIPYLSHSLLPPENQLPLDDLWLSLRNGELVLRSKRLNKRVIPFHTNAVNGSSSNLPVFKFLYDLQQQDSHAIITDWGWSLLAEQRFLPRVEFGRLILSPARWMLYKADFADLSQAAPADLPALFAPHFRASAIPQHVLLLEADNELLIDTTNPVSLQYLAEYLARQGYVKLCEFLQAPASCVVTSAAGHHVSELLLPFPAAGRATPADLPTAQPLAPAPTRTFVPGSEWLFCKLYCGPATAERLLTHDLAPTIEHLQAAGLVEKWFFIRYADPQPHLRLRFFSTTPGFGQPVIDALNAALAPAVADGQVRQVQLDTYQRELERYGPATMEGSETLFWHDSQAVVQLLQLVESSGTEDLRWQVALLGTDQLVESFGYDLRAKVQFYKLLSQRFLAEVRADKNFTVQLDTAYRHKQRLIAAVLQPDDSDELAIARQLLHERATRSAVARAAIRHTLSGAALDELLASLVHMFLNRLFLAQPRQQELVVYFYLARHFESGLARLTKTPAARAALTP
jgi:thiopeptide-type bacteriocin biosynthesis protein